MTRSSPITVTTELCLVSTKGLKMSKAIFLETPLHKKRTKIRKVFCLSYKMGQIENKTKNIKVFGLSNENAKHMSVDMILSTGTFVQHCYTVGQYGKLCHVIHLQGVIHNYV